MREIKFRGKSIEDSKWIYGSLMHHQPFIDVRYYIKNEDKGMIQWHHVDASTCGQFTGFVDIKGVQIYEGDIVRYDPDFSHIVEVVEWKENMWTEEGFMTGFGDFFGNLRDYVIIGNIHDNPDLL